MRSVPIYMTERGDDGIGGCIPDGTYTSEAAAELYGFGTVVSDTDGDYCTIEGGDTDIVVAADGSTFTIEGDLFTSRAGTTAVCDADGTCDAGEDCVGCPGDCGSGSGASCGDGVCSAGNGEDCVSCPADCRGKQSGKPSSRYCCGDGDGENPITCADPICTANGAACTDTPAAPWCCGDGTCGGGAETNSCELDCGPAPYCGDGTCDADEDSCSCAADCGGSCTPPACDDDGVCDPGEDCNTCASDCAGVSGGRPANRHCCGDGTADGAEGDGSICDGNY